MGCDWRLGVRIHQKSKFQSTHPVWGATCESLTANCEPPDFNPRTPCGVRPRRRRRLRPWSPISIHAPRVGCDDFFPFFCRIFRISIHAPRVGCDVVNINGESETIDISIHAPRVGCDYWVCFYTSHKIYFNPRTPCGVRHLRLGDGLQRLEFQSTHPVWGATEISSCSTSPWRFQSTHPVWGATPVTRHEKTSP